MSLKSNIERGFIRNVTIELHGEYYNWCKENGLPCIAYYKAHRNYTLAIETGVEAGKTFNLEGMKRFYMLKYG